MRSALYYPHTTIENEGLVKTALLMWDRLEFIVPWKQFKPEYDDPKIERAIELIGYAHCPDDEEKKETHARIKELVRRRLPPQFYTTSRLPSRRRDVYEVYPQKLLPETWTLLDKAQLSGKLLPNSDYPLTQFGGLTVMAILADCCAGSTRCRITDRGDAYATLAGFLGNRSNELPVKKSDAHEQLVGVSLDIIDTPNVDLNSLIKFREREEKESGTTLRELRHRYVASLETYVSKLTSEKCRKSDAEEIRRQFADDMKADLRNLRKELGFARKDALLSKEVLVTTVAALGTAASWAFGVPVSLAGVLTLGGGAATVGGLLATRNKYLSARHGVMQKHPMAYMYEVQKQTPIRLIESIPNPAYALGRRRGRQLPRE
jgi:hypothetical protein